MRMTLYFRPGAASLAPHVCLLKAGADLTLQEVPREELTAPWYRALNPSARVPTLVVESDGPGATDTQGAPLIVREAAAICLFAADRFPRAALLPGDTAARAMALDWLIYLSNTVQSDLMVMNYARRYVESHEAAEELRAGASQRLGGMFGLIDAHLSETGLWMAGGAPCCADYFLTMLAGWAERFGIDDPPSVRSKVLDHARRCQDLPEFAAALEAEGQAAVFR
jgi:glutathione S-transferase